MRYVPMERGCSTEETRYVPFLPHLRFRGGERVRGVVRTGYLWTHASRLFARHGVKVSLQSRRDFSTH